jgi:hypothetical protein
LDEPENGLGRFRVFPQFFEFYVFVQPFPDVRSLSGSRSSAARVERVAAHREYRPHHFDFGEDVIGVVITALGGRKSAEFGATSPFVNQSQPIVGRQRSFVPVWLHT